MNSAQNKTKSNFGVTGWYLIVFTALLFYLNTGITTDGLNVTVAKFSELNGWAQSELLNFSTISGYIAIITAPFLSAVIAKLGARISVCIMLIAAGLATIWWGMASTPVQYMAASAIVTACANGYSHLCSSTLANNWFPTKKGLFLGWSTMGLQLSTVAYVAMITFLMAHMGLTGAYILLGIVQIVFAVLAFFTIKDSPLEAGKYPDNIPMSEEELAAYKAQEENYVSSLTLKKILSTRETWLIGISFGVLYMASIGLLSQWVPRLLTLGYQQNTAILMLSIASAIGIFGSYAWGWLDMKIGPKKASVGIMINYAAALILVILPHSPILLYLAMFLIGMGIGGVANLVGSLVGTIWGHRDFPRVFGIINTIEGIVRVTAFSVLAFGLTHLGGYSGAYCIFLALVIIGIIMMVLVREDAAVK